MSKNSNLHKAKKAKNDEFYTLYEDIESIKYYTTSLVGKRIYCPCDNPAHSNFYKFFKDNFHKLQLKELIATFYSPDFNPLDSFTDALSTAPTKTVYDGTEERIYQLHSNGDFQSEECQEILKEADIIITNPPFSIFRKFVLTIIEHQKQFLILGQLLCASNNTIFPLFKENRIHLGISKHSFFFNIPELLYYPNSDSSIRQSKNGTYQVQIQGIRWFTNLPLNNKQPSKSYTSLYSPEKYPSYINYPAIHISRETDIPSDYTGEMGVPITILDNFDHKSFELVALGIGNNIPFNPIKRMELLKEGQPTGKFTMNR